MISCEVKETFGTIGTKKDKVGDPMEVRLCLVCWGGGKPVYDLRGWTMDGKASKGLTMTAEMLRELRNILQTLDLDEQTP